MYAYIYNKPYIRVLYTYSEISWLDLGAIILEKKKKEKCLAYVYNVYSRLMMQEKEKDFKSIEPAISETRHM